MLTLAIRKDGSVQDIQRKDDVRSAVSRGRAALGAEARAAASRVMRDTLLTLPEVEMAGSIAAYVSMDTEPDTHGLIFALWKRGSYVLLPRLLPDNDLDWSSYEGPDSLRPGPAGFPESTEPARGVEAIKAADVVIVPALAVDRTGVRLGRGGGSYDRALARVQPSILTVSMVFDSELVDRLPSEPHDRPVRAVITPSHGLERFR